MQNVHLICIFIFCVLLVGCSEPSKTLDATSDTFPSVSAEMPTISPFPTASPSVFPTQTSLPTATFTPHPTITPKVETHDIYIEEEILDIPDLQGNLIGRDKFSTQQELFKLPQWDRIPLPGNDPSFSPFRLTFVSPDGRKLAYQDYTPEKNLDMRIITGDAIAVNESSRAEAGDWDIINWLDNQRLALAEISHRDGTVFIYDSSTGEVSELKPFFPVTTEKGIIAPGGTLAVPYVYYDPTLTRLVIVRYDNDQPLSNYELWDVTNQTLLWEASGLSLDTSPVWSPSGQSFALSIMPNPPDEELYCSELLLVGYDGEQLLTDDCVGSGLSWSPEGQFLAVWKVGHGDICPIPYDTTQLLVIEVGTGKRDIFTLCESGEGGIFLSQHPVWSPDGRFIAFNIFDTSLSSTGAIILDRVQWRAYDLPDLAEINGWIKSNP